MEKNEEYLPSSPLTQFRKRIPWLLILMLSTTVTGMIITAFEGALAAQAADEILDIVGVTTSFVLFSDGENVIISARSVGEANVQVILETLGGGGNAATAGAQIPGKSVSEVLVDLQAAIDQYYSE